MPKVNMWYKTDDEKLDIWTAEGSMTPERILERLLEDRINLGLSDKEHEGLKRFFDAYSTREAGTAHLSEEAVISYLKSRAPIPSLLEEGGYILYHSLLYLSRFPFQLGSLQTMSFEELARALLWALADIDFDFMRGNFIVQGSECRGRTWADHRRGIFQSLATSRDGTKLPYDSQEWKKQADIRAFQFLKRDIFGPQDATVNRDEDGDEMYHDVLDVLFSSQIEISPCLASVPRNKFRPLAKKLHGTDPYLHQLTIPQKAFHIFVKLLVIYHFEPHSWPKVTEISDLERVSSCIAKAFIRNPDTGISWPMFDEAFKVAPWFLGGYYHLLSNLFGPVEPGQGLGSNVDEWVELPNTTDILTFPVMGQLGIMFSATGLFFYEFHRLQYYTPGSHETNKSALMKEICAAPSALCLLVSGKNKRNGEYSLFGSFIGVPSKDGEEIQSTEKEDINHWQNCCLFELSPVHDKFQGNVGLPGWTSDGSTLCFGNKENGVALELSSDLRYANIFHKVGGSGQPVFNASAWRGDWHCEIEVEGIELWCDGYIECSE